MSDRSELMTVRIFLASPSDVMSERALVRGVADRLEFEARYHGQIGIELVAWDDVSPNSPVYASMAPQTAMSQGLPRPSECDIVIVIMWSQFGTPLAFPEYRKADGSAFLSGTEWEYHDALTRSQRDKGKPAVLVYRRTEEPKIGLNDPARDERIRQWTAVERFFSNFVDSSGALLGGYFSYETPARFEERLASDLRMELDKALSSDVRRDTRSRSSRSENAVTRWKGSPFPGLRPFTPADAPVFFGRTAEVDNLLELLGNPNNRFVAVVGASGSGKSSLVAAGLLPRLKANGIQGSKDWLLPDLNSGAMRSNAWSGVRFTPSEVGDDPFLAVALKLAPLIQRERGTPRDLANRFATSEAALRDTCLLALADQPAWSQILIFVDQFEELLTTVASRFCGSFLRAITRACESARVRVVVTIRSDFYSRFIEMDAIGSLLRLGTYPLALPGVVARTDMIIGPAARAGLTLERGLVDQIVSDSGSDQGALALLAFALHELYKTAEKPRVLTRSGYQSLGGVAAAIGRKAEQTFSELSSGAQAEMGSIFSKLVVLDASGVATRIRVPRSRLPQGDDSDEFLDAFISARLLVSDTGPEGWVIDVAHEALLREWPALRHWIAERSDDLRLLRQAETASAEWSRRNYPESHLWPHERLETFSQALARLGVSAVHLDETLQRFIVPEAERLLAALGSIDTSHARRVVIGDRLAQIGDPRPGIGVTVEGLPDFIWCDATPGGFQVLKYPVTFTQYRSFVTSSDGFDADAWWKSLERPVAPGTPFRKIGNCPVDNVSWFDAVAFSRWVSARLGYPVRLPTEAEWTIAATHGGSRDYPWGSVWEANRANSQESDLGRTTAVGLYPDGAAACGAMDLAGNVWEWCLNSYRDPAILEADQTGLKAIKGGSWLNTAEDARCSKRGGNLPATRVFNIGFRLIRNFA